MTTVLVTGANGFIGKSLCDMLKKSGFQVRAAIRSGSLPDTGDTAQFQIFTSIGGQTDWQACLQGIDVVVHLAARVHVMHETAVDSLQAFREVNTEGTHNLAIQAAAAGVKRFIFISTLKVLGEQTFSNAFNAESPAAPVDAYAISKWEAEQALVKCTQTSDMEVVIIRPPLVYGPGVKGNFLRLMQLVQREWPLPLSAIENQRSLVFVENLNELITLCVGHPSVAGQTLLVADTESLSTPQLFNQLANAMGKSSRLWFVPVAVLKFLAKLIGRRAEIDRLCDSMQVDASKTYQLLNWHPSYSVSQALITTVAHFLTEKL